jgi:hypothetical protein
MNLTLISILLSLLCAPLFSAGGFAHAGMPDGEKPLPELNAFIARVTENLKSDRLLQSQYTYNMRETTQRLDKDGHVKKTEVHLYEVYPSLDEDMTYQRLISENGKPVDPKKLEEEDRDYSKKAEERARKLAKDHRSEQEQRLAEETEASQKERKIIGELSKIYEIVLLHREIVDNHSAILVQFTPRPEYKPETREEKILKKIKGQALVSETDYQIIRAEVELVDDYSIGLGLLARVYKGAQMLFVRRKVNDEIWLPAEFHFIGSARALVFKQFRIDSTSLFSDYKKFSVTSSFEFSSRKPPN